MSPIDSTNTVRKIQQLTDEQRKLQADLYEKFRRFTMVKVQMMSEAIEGVFDRGYTSDEIRTKSNRENIFEEYLELNYGTETLPDWQAVYKVEALGEKQADKSVVIKEVKGYWLKTVLDKVA